MTRIDLETYFRNLFKNVTYDYEHVKGINAAHAISSEYYDVQFGRNSITYRDKINTLIIPIEHDMDHTIVIYLTYYIENNNNLNIDVDILKKRISTILDFLKVKYLFE